MFKPIENQREIYSLFVKKFSKEKQELKVAEECSELSQAIIKNTINPSPKTYRNILDEMGDVLNAIDSFCFIHDIDINEIHSSRIDKLQNTFYKFRD